MDMTAVIYHFLHSLIENVHRADQWRRRRLSLAFGSHEGHTFVAQRIESMIWNTSFYLSDWVWIYLINNRSHQHTTGINYGYSELNWLYLRGRFLGRSRCVPHRGGQPATGRLRRRSWAGLKDLKAVSHQTERKENKLNPFSPAGFSL